MSGGMYGVSFPIKAIIVALAFLNYALRYHFYFVLAVYYIPT
jgi:hypothetical protein